ncbi:hypothetical protein [Ekhidna sp.]|uniref:hypothetical protein n=1 Tax=Ekhidna sp. TaxID=2608089 RepID=UPI003BA9DC3C
MKFFKLVSAFSSLLLLASCANEKGPTPISEMQTYEVIQTQIWDTQCISCHAAGSSFARQSDLVLTTGESYDQLVGRAPNNKAALEDGLELVGNEGLPSLFKSYLWEKLNANDQEHFYSDHPLYGAIMPLGADFLTNGELEFIIEWIINGAPKTGQVADVAILNDETRFEALPFEPLAKPESGFQFHLGPFEIDPQTDREFFYYEPPVSDEDIYINQIEITMRQGSHHFIFYAFEDETPSVAIPEPLEIRDLYDENQQPITKNLIPLLYHEFIAGTQWPRMNYHYPEGVALKFNAGKGLDLNAHYANRTDNVMIGEVYGNLHTIPFSEVEHVAEILNLNNQNFTLPAGKVTTITKDYFFNERINIFQLFSHAHEHMTEFKVYHVGGPKDGELIYISYDWEHPPILEFDPPHVLEPGEALRLEATYDNWENRDLKFGLRSSDEMMILFGAYYVD